MFLQLQQIRPGDGVTGGAECPHCFKIMKNPNNMKRHILTHIGDKPFICDICNQAFPRKDYLTVHRRSHTGEKPFACHLCDYRSPQSSNLKTHLRTKHFN